MAAVHTVRLVTCKGSNLVAPGEICYWIDSSSDDLFGETRMGWPISCANCSASLIGTTRLPTVCKQRLLQCANQWTYNSWCFILLNPSCNTMYLACHVRSTIIILCPALTKWQRKSVQAILDAHGQCGCVCLRNMNSLGASWMLKAIHPSNVNAKLLLMGDICGFIH